MGSVGKMISNKLYVSFFLSMAVGVIAVMFHFEFHFFISHPVVSLLLGVFLLECGKEVFLVTLDVFSETTSTKLDDMLVESLTEQLRAPQAQILFLLLSIWASSHFLIDVSLEDFLSACNLVHTVNKVRSVLHFMKLGACIWGLLRLTECATRMARICVAFLDGHKEHKSLKTPVAIVVRYSMLTAGLFIIALSWGFDVHTAMTTIGFFSLGISLSLKEVFEDIFDLIILSVDRPYHIGSEVCINGLWGEVEAMGFRSTRLRGYDGLQYVMPHNKVKNADITNNSYDTVDSNRVTLSIELAWTTTPAQLEGMAALFKEVVESEPAHHMVWARMTQLTEHGYEWTVKFYVEKERFPGDAESTTLIRCVKAVKKAGLELAQEKRLELATWQAQQYAAAALPGAQK